ncbi:MAG: hypothetical protein ACKVSF_06920 [Alphaproteobacteria bacterium]
MTAAITHLTHSSPEPLRIWCADFRTYVTVSTATGGAVRARAGIASPKAPGLGVEPLESVLGQLLVEIS